MARLELTRPLLVFLWSFTIVGILVTSVRLYQMDIWWQLPEGTSILATGHLPTQAPAAFGIPREPFFDEYGLYEVIIAAVYHAGGFMLLWPLFAAVYLAIYFIPIGSGSRRHLNFSLLSTLLLQLAMILLANRLEQRPDLVGALFLVLLLNLLRDARLKALAWKWHVAVIVLFCCWSNTHGSVLVGLGALSLWLLCEFLFGNRNAGLRKKALLVLGAALGGTLLNPYGLPRFIFPFWEQGDMGSTVLSAEMLPVSQQSPVIGGLLLMTGMLMVCACVSARRPRLWLMVFGFGTLAMTAFNFRFATLLAVSLIFFHAERQFVAPESPTTNECWPKFRTAVLLLLCVAFFYLNVAWSVMIVRQHAQQGTLARADRVFAPQLVDELKAQAEPNAALLCHFGEGSYVTFVGEDRLHPLMDSGLSRFSDETKRCQYFIEHEPGAFSSALDLMEVRYILVTRPVDWWVLVLAQRHGWTLDRCSEEGFVFQRASGVATSPSPQDVEKIAGLRESFLQDEDYVSAFCCSLLIESPAQSVSILDRSFSTQWSEAFFLALDDWLDALPLDDLYAIESKLTAPGGNHLLREMVWTKLHPRQAGGFAIPFTKNDNRWLADILRLRTLIGAGEADLARQEFDQLKNRPFVSSAYPDLWNELRQATLPSEHRLTRAEAWQAWDARSEEMFRKTCAQLNKRISDFH